jgi:hypothetical protein
MNDEYQTRQFFGNCDMTEITLSNTGHLITTNCPRFGPKFILVINKAKYENHHKNDSVQNIQGVLRFICGEQKNT